MTETFEYAVPADHASAPRSSVVIAVTAVLAFLVFLFVAGARPAHAQGAPPPSIEFTNVSVVDVEKGVVLPNMRVVVVGERIMTVTKERRNLFLPASRDRVDGTGKYLIPGLWDMHIHSSYPGFPAVMAPQYTANGVTGVREMFGDLGVVKEWRSHAASADTIWPRIVASGHIVDGKPPIWPTSVVAVTEDDVWIQVDFWMA